MSGTNDVPDRNKPRKRDSTHPDDRTETPDPKDPAFQAARELGKQLAKGAAFVAGKHAADAAFNEISQNPDDNFFTRLLDWIQSL